MGEWLRKPGVPVLGVLLLGAAATVGLYRSRAPHPHSVTLHWHAPAAFVKSQAVSYNIYRSTSPGGPYTPVASGVQSLTYKDELVNPGVTYYYVVRSVDLSGRESGYSEEVKVTIPDR